MPAWMSFGFLLLQVFLALYGERLNGVALFLNDGIGLIVSVLAAFSWLNPVEGETFIAIGSLMAIVSAFFGMVFAIRLTVAALAMLKTGDGR